MIPWNGADQGWRRNASLDLPRRLRHTDDLPHTRALAEASNFAEAIDEHGNALLELDQALMRVEDDLKG